MRIKCLFWGLLRIFSLMFLVCSCSTGEVAAQILGTSSAAPVFLACRAVSGTEIDFEFSLPVKVVSLSFSPSIAVESIDEGSIVRVNFAAGLEPGERLTADLLAEDENGNTINVLTPLRTRNERLPRLLISELRTEYSKPKAEFVEFKILEAGNLGAAQVFIAGNSKKPFVYEFSPVEVAAGDYVVLHLRSTEETNRDEYGSNLSESGGVDSAPNARDFWVFGSEKLLRKTDAVYVLNQDDEVIDAVLLAENPASFWSKDYLANAADFLYQKGAWKTAGETMPEPKDAVITGKTTLTRSICRDETAADTDSPDNWYITVTGGATPGKPNNSSRFE